MKKTLLTFIAIFACLTIFAANVTVHDIQYTTDAAGASPYATQVVTTTGTVVGIYTTAAGVRSGFYLQGAAGAWNGIYVYAGTTGAGASLTCVAGDSITVTATVSEYNGLTELGTITACTVIASGKNYTINEISTSAANTEQWEGCIVKVKNANCTGGTAGTFNVTDGSGTLAIFKQLYQALALTTGTNYDITGIMTWYSTGSIFELIPRSASDITVATGFSNPTSDFSVKLAGKTLSVSDATTSTVEIFSALGAKVQNVELVNGSADLNLSKGLYIVRSGNNTAKIMIK